jgi:hypothetical protein
MYSTPAASRSPRCQEILAPFFKFIPALSYLSGPAPGTNISRALFNISEDIRHALILLAYNVWLHNIVAALPFRPPIYGYLVFRYGTLRITFAGSLTVHSFHCALLAGRWNHFCLSHQEILEYSYEDLSDPVYFSDTHLCVNDGQVPFVEQHM